MRILQNACAGIATGLLLGILIVSNASAQSSAYRAQGHYYSAKDAYEGGRSEEAIDYVKKSKAALGGTNRELQYLHVMSAYSAGRYEEAQREMQVFFDLADKKIQAIDFSSAVDRLTENEVRALTKLINKIDDAVAKSAANRKSREEDSKLASDLSGTWSLSSGPSNHVGARVFKVQHHKKSLFLTTSDQKTVFGGELVSDTSSATTWRGVASYHYPARCGRESFEGIFGGAPDSATASYDKKSRTLTVIAPNEVNTNCEARISGSRSYVFVRQ